MERTERPEHGGGLIVVDNETKSSTVRTTVDGKKITYRLNILQQPERARACGQGAKSSADRRPVDPPPIVELKIFEGENAENDITFTISANYFLFVTLDNARYIAHGRVPGDRHTPPVLTGTPVAGIVYLDRPEPAGYFIFPDLSVRHEGRYRLAFSLFEEVKTRSLEDKSQDGTNACPAGELNAHVAHRLEVKSEVFTVYSAKKFPGLSESTMLSRTVAEQGCRVRIRRDVRMRRRETKNDDKGWDDYDHHSAELRARLSATPDPNAYASMPAQHGFADPISRPRSASSASHLSQGVPLSRRTSLQEMNQAYNNHSQYNTAPHVPHNAYAQASPYPQPPFLQHPHAMQPPTAQYQMQTFAPPPPPPPPSSAAAPQPFYGYPPASQYNHYETVPQPQRMSVDYPSQMQNDYRRSSAQQAGPPPPHQMGYAQPQYQHPGAPQHSHPSHRQSYSSANDLYSSRPEPMQPSASAAGASTPMGRSFGLPPLNTSIMSAGRLEASSPLSAAPSASFNGPMHTPIDSHKRSYGDVFSEKHQGQSLRHGARPSAAYSDSVALPGASGLSAATADDEDNGSGELNLDTMNMLYRRADGRQVNRPLHPQA